MKRTLLLGFLACMLVGAVVFVRSGIHRIALPTVSGITAKQVCSLYFVSGFTPEEARDRYVDPLLAGAAPLVLSRVEGREVRAGILGIFYRQRAIYREGLGCTLVHDGRDFDPDLTLPGMGLPQRMMLDTDHRALHFDENALDRALEDAFAEPAGGGRNTLAVVILHRGRLVAERYAEGVTWTTPLHGWSMAKSAAATLAGTMVERGELDLDHPGITLEKVLAEDPRKADITLGHLLRMTAGLALDELEAGFDPNSEMMFTRSDMADWAARRPLAHEPGAVWDYMSGQTVLAMRAMQRVIPGGVREHALAVRTRVFEPLGMHTAVFEVDEAGTLQGGSYLYASAQDWARLAQLYLDDGMAGSFRVLPAEWTEVVSSPAEGTERGNAGYGPGFWLGHSGVDGDAFYMSGFQGQATYVLPDHDLVVVRLGATHAGNPGAFDLTAAAVEALSPVRAEEEG